MKVGNVLGQVLILLSLIIVVIVVLLFSLEKFQLEEHQELALLFSPFVSFFLDYLKADYIFRLLNPLIFQCV